MKKLLLALLACIAITASAINITVPQAPGANYVLLSTTTGSYFYVATSSLGIAGGGSSAPWFDGGTTIYATPTTRFVGIGTTTSTGILTVQGTSTSAANFPFRVMNSLGSPVLAVSDGASVTTSGNITATANVFAGGSSFLGFTGSTVIRSPANGTLGFSNQGLTLGFRASFASTTATDTVAFLNLGGTARAGIDVATTTADCFLLRSTGTCLASGGGGTPAGSNGQIQFNDSGSFGATSTLFYNNSTGLVGIGTPSPDDILHVYGSSTTVPVTLKVQNIGGSSADSELLLSTSGTVTNTAVGASILGDRVNADGTTDTAFRSSQGVNLLERMRILGSNGFVGIGTSSPSSVLTVVAPASQGNGGYFGGNVNGFFQLNMQNLNSGTNASTDLVATADNGDDSTHYIDTGINGSSGGVAPFTAPNEAYVYSATDGLSVGAFGTTSAVKIFTGTTTAGMVERMRIDANGNVGVGTSTPSSVLTVVGTTTSAGTALNIFSSAGVSAMSVTDGGIVSSRTAFVGAFGGPSVAAYRFSSVNGGLYTITTNTIGLSTNSINRMTWDAAGNVGMGSTTPAYRFAVASTTNGQNLFSVGNAGQILTGSGGAASTTATTCGTAPSILGNDTSGTVSVGSGVVTACTVTFGTPKATVPHAQVTAQNATFGYVTAISTSSATFTFSGSITSAKFSYLFTESN